LWACVQAPALRLASVVFTKCSAPYGGGWLLRRRLNVTDGITTFSAADADSIQMQAVLFEDNVASAAGGAYGNSQVITL